MPDSPSDHLTKKPPLGVGFSDGFYAVTRDHQKADYKVAPNRLIRRYRAETEASADSPSTTLGGPLVSPAFGGITPQSHARHAGAARESFKLSLAA
jgi:hypothetical protein